MQEGTRKTENFHILLWLIKDLCWVSLSRLAGVIMIGPTIGLAIYITFLNRKHISELVHNLAVCFWITANSIWMIGEFYFEDQSRKIAIVFFVIGLAILLGYYGKLLLSYEKRKRQ